MSDDSGHESAQEEASLPNLLSSLALGARAVHGLPLEDDYFFQSSFPEFASLSQSCRQELVQALSISLEDPSLVEASTSDSLDPSLWNKCADACDALVEKVEAYLENSTTATQPLEQWSDRARQQAQSSHGRMMAMMVDMEKPQVTFGIKPQNDRRKPFVPRLTTKHHAVVPLSLEPLEGHGLNTRFGDLQRSSVYPNMIAPSHHVPHVYREEIVSFEYQPWQLEPPSTKPPPIQAADDTLTATWIDTREGLEDLVEQLEGVKQVAIDLEAHSYRTFAGITCLMQMSFRLEESGATQSYLVDTLALWHDMQNCLAPLFANPKILKVMHGADSDVQWLQRDFAIYIVNLFDTGRASRALGLAKAGLAFLLQKYAGVETDKTFQLSDWRQRPLSDEMRKYAIMDTHYLLDIYDRLLWDLNLHPNTSVQAVLDVSRKVCLIRYDKEPFYPMRYKLLLNNSRNKKKRTDLTDRQERVLSSLFDWRDQTARNLDESIHYVCNDKGLLRLALSCPTTLTLLQTCMNPMPPLVLQCAQDIVNCMKEAIGQRELGPRRPPSSAFFKPAKPDNDDEQLRRATGILSPVLPTEALYKQAGWMTPQQVVAEAAGAPSAEIAAPTTTEEDEEGLDPTTTKPRHLLMVHSANKDYRSTNNYTLHSLEMTASSSEQQRTVDGLGPARAMLGNHDRDDAPLLEEESERAKESAARIRIDMAREKEDLLGVVTSHEEPGEDEDDDDEIKEEGEESDNEKEFEIPRSMREIYRVSNLNRRKNKKSSSPSQGTSSESNTNVVAHSEPLKVDTLEGAEAVLATAGLDGKGYFDGASKRQRTKSEDDDSSAKSVEKSRNDDINFMEQIGWVKNRQEAEEMVLERRQSDGSADKDSEDQNQTKESAKQRPVFPPQPQDFDFSSIGSIGVFHPNVPPANNPFFAGAAIAGGGPLTSTQTTVPAARSERKKKKDKTTRGGAKQERPEKKDGRSFVYKKR